MANKYYIPRIKDPVTNEYIRYSTTDIHRVQCSVEEPVNPNVQIWILPSTETVYTDTGKEVASNDYTVYVRGVDDTWHNLAGGDMLRVVYDTNNSGVVDDAERLGGQLPEYYANSQDLENLKNEVEETISGGVYSKTETDNIVTNINTQIANIINGTTTVAKATSATDNTKLPLAGGTITGVTKISNTTASTSTTTGALVVAGGIGCAGNIYGSKVYGAVYNDYAERRKSNAEIKAGYVVNEIGDDIVIQCTKDMCSTALVVSDTYGALIGEAEDEQHYSIPVGLSGRVLAYVSPLSKRVRLGDTVCSSRDGMIRRMRWYEKILHPECIIGVVGSIPNYAVWGDENILVNGRVWINLK